MQSPQASLTHHLELEGGRLDYLKLSPQEHQLRYSPTAFNMFDPTEAASSVIGDYIGTESCLDLEHNVKMLIALNSTGDESVNKTASNHDLQDAYRKYSRGKRDWRLAREKKEFPPPIPLLARTGNLQSHMPWVLRRHYTSDGRLILTEEKVRHHEYFRAHRANGRLTLQLVPLDNDDDDDDAGINPSADDDQEDQPQSDISDHEEDERAILDIDNNINNNGDIGGDVSLGEAENHEKEIVLHHHEDWSSSSVINNEPTTTNGSSGMGSSVNGVSKCLNYNNIVGSAGSSSPSPSSSIFGVPVTAISTVQS
ncbi:hypothetical protein I3843_06G021800 [Carya illinoinensis]|uniref:FAF domain-containing protein n=1 Tax=Carya illinoinensis TaxID=32201 RepID=A0A922ETD4_CARIL|nr:hypothetical protein I3842_06G023000 [Carya illinoinensis]KAG7973955.1 hypothetical protein I3843_06G021800 [Carya illinoinensis]